MFPMAATFLTTTSRRGRPAHGTSRRLWTTTPTSWLSSLRTRSTRVGSGRSTPSIWMRPVPIMSTSVVLRFQMFRMACSTTTCSLLTPKGRSLIPAMSRDAVLGSISDRCGRSCSPQSWPISWATTSCASASMSGSITSTTTLRRSSGMALSVSTQPSSMATTITPSPAPQRARRLTTSTKSVPNIPKAQKTNSPFISLIRGRSLLSSVCSMVLASNTTACLPTA